MTASTSNLRRLVRRIAIQSGLKCKKGRCDSDALMWDCWAGQSHDEVVFPERVFTQMWREPFTVAPLEP